MACLTQNNINIYMSTFIRILFRSTAPKIMSSSCMTAYLDVRNLSLYFVTYGIYKNCSTKFVNLYAIYFTLYTGFLHGNMILQKWTNVHLSTMRHKEYWISKDNHLIHLTTSNADPPLPRLHKRICWVVLEMKHIVRCTECTEHIAFTLFTCKH
jgi:hypothetical protein